jgi:hypothetical protein
VTWVVRQLQSSNIAIAEGPLQGMNSSMEVNSIVKDRVEALSEIDTRDWGA